MRPMKTPGVYVVEKSAFPNSVVQVATAVPAFIGYTEKAELGNTSLHMVPRRLSSMAEFETHFGLAASPSFDIKKRPDPDEVDKIFSPAGMMMTDPLPKASFKMRDLDDNEIIWDLEQVGPKYALYAAMRSFFLNGGGACYVVSIGQYGTKSPMEQPDIEAAPMLAAIKKLVKEPEPTMVVIPETTRLTRQDSFTVQQAMLAHCGGKMKNRFAVLDIFGGHNDLDGEAGKPVAAFRNDIGTSYLDFGAAYYPWLNSSIYNSRNFSFLNIAPSSRIRLMKILKTSLGAPNDAVKAELARISAPRLSGDFKLSVALGQTVPVTLADISARDDRDASSDAALSDVAQADQLAADDKLTFTVAGDADSMRGQLENTDNAGTAITEFEQADLEAGKIVFKHTGTDATPGQFTLKATDEDGFSTAVKTIDVDVGATTDDAVVIKLGDTVPPIDVLANDPGADADTLKIVNADDGSDGKTKTVDKVGVWAVDDGKITFTADDKFTGPLAEISYVVDVTTQDSDGNDVVQTSDKTTVQVYYGDQSRLDPELDGPSDEAIDKTLRVIAPLYGEVMDAITTYMNCLPPAAAMAGIYTMIDNNRGVWKAPANVSMAAVASPTVNIDADQQEDLNVTPQGKSINAIRPFVGEGTLVWGARTLDGNSLDWRYISVRRTMIMIEESIRLASKAYVFEPNTANTWVTMRSMIENFLTGVWKQGGLAGAVPTDAFSVHVGLGETMTPEDILEGILRITVLVAVTRPAEFIEITFQQQMQKS